jgi:hypothetical protein
MSERKRFERRTIVAAVMKLNPILAALAAFSFARGASGQTSTDWKYEVGLRSTVMVTAMPLSGLGDGFEDLPAGGKSLPHASSLFVMWPLGKHLRVGVETLVGNSFAESDTETEILFQASGVTAEYQTAGTWFAAVSVQAGGIIASAQSFDSDADDAALRTGASFKDSGVFVAPQLSLGRRVRAFDIRLVGKQVWQFGSGAFDAFDSFYAGISVGIVRR